MPETIIRPATWNDDAEALSAVRTAVFVMEQKVAQELEIDGQDPDCDHAIALMDGTPVGAGRIQACGHIGRVAVLAEHRGKGIGTKLMHCLISQSKAPCVYLSSQLHAVDFYQRLGFVSEGKVFVEAGIQHLKMSLNRGNT